MSKKSIAGVFLVALALRVLFVWTQSHYHVFDIYFVASDSRLYQQMAWDFLDGYGFQTGMVMPLYPLFLAACITLGFGTALGIGLAQCVIGAATCVLVAWLSWKVYPDVSPWIAGLLAAGNLHLIFWTGYVLTETLFVFWVVASLCALMWWKAQEPNLTRTLLPAACCIAAMLTRSHWFLFVMVLTFVWWRSWEDNPLMILACCFVAVFVAAHAMDAPPLTAMSGEVLYQGNSDGATGGSGGYLDARDFQRLILPAKSTQFDSNEAYKSAAFTFMRHHPFRVLALMPLKFWNQWRPTYANASIRNWLLFGWSYLVLVGLALIGICVGGRAGSSVLLTALLFTIGLHLIVPGMIRYRLPVEPILIVYASKGLAWLWA